MTPRIPSDVVVGQYLQMFAITVARYICFGVAVYQTTSSLIGRSNDLLKRSYTTARRYQIQINQLFVYSYNQ